MPDPLRILITAGPTHEPIDAVRFIGNRSSGRMGTALANESARRGYATTLLLGPVEIEALGLHSQIHTLRFQTAADLHELLLRHWSEHDVLIMAAAVADFRPAQFNSERKLDRRAGGVTLSLEPVPDLLASLDDLTTAEQMRIGFALEAPERLGESARRKLIEKNVEAIIANPLESMDSPDIAGIIFLADGQELRPPAPSLKKTDFAAWLLDQLPRIRSLRTRD